MTFLRDHIVGKIYFGDRVLLPGGYEKEEFINSEI